MKIKFLALLSVFGFKLFSCEQIFQHKTEHAILANLNSQHEAIIDMKPITAYSKIRHLFDNNVNCENLYIPSNNIYNKTLRDFLEFTSEFNKVKIIENNDLKSSEAFEILIDSMFKKISEYKFTCSSSGINELTLNSVDNRILYYANLFKSIKMCRFQQKNNSAYKTTSLPRSKYNICCSQQSLTQESLSPSIIKINKVNVADTLCYINNVDDEHQNIELINRIFDTNTIDRLLDFDYNGEIADSIASLMIKDPVLKSYRKKAHDSNPSSKGFELYSLELFCRVIEFLIDSESNRRLRFDCKLSYGRILSAYKRIDPKSTAPHHVWCDIPILKNDASQKTNSNFQKTIVKHFDDISNTCHCSLFRLQEDSYTTSLYKAYFGV